MFQTGKSPLEGLRVRGGQGGEGVRGWRAQPLHGDSGGAPLRHQQDGPLDRQQELGIDRLFDIVIGIDIDNIRFLQLLYTFL